MFFSKKGIVKELTLLAEKYLDDYMAFLLLYIVGEPFPLICHTVPIDSTCQSSLNGTFNGQPLFHMSTEHMPFFYYFFLHMLVFWDLDLHKTHPIYRALFQTM